MAPQVWPIPPEGFIDLLGFETATFGLPADLSPSITGGGDVIAHRRGSRLWQGEVTLGRSEHADIAAQSALIEHLLEPGASFMVYDRRLPPPQDPAHPTQIDWDTQPVTIKSLIPGNRELSLRGLPANFTLRRGQLLGWQYLTDPVRYALHRIVDATVTSNGVGETARFEVTPFIRPGVALETPVILAWPTCKAKMLSWKPGPGRSSVSQGGSFTWQQTLR
ncbi:hypothetical protein [uncultured Roseovarius sp.]|uniref:hypothetical protein n=1 Tax=uncultured Roseovarius sp. TaxID=293344 RepID=UPI002605C5F4|nr:hypothetical protein [uncultured Roseovarius sp.]